MGLRVQRELWALGARSGQAAVVFDRGNEVTGPFLFPWISKYVNQWVLSRTVMIVVTRQLPRGHGRAIPERRD